jgi:predicted RNA-binding Zn-ribbon protein involved in translation (DUF1610 family)
MLSIQAEKCRDFGWSEYECHVCGNLNPKIPRV